MKIIRKREHVECVEYRRYYEYADQPGGGFSFPSDMHGTVDASKLSDAAKENLLACALGTVKTQSGPVKMIDMGVERFEHSYWEPAVGQCSCGLEVYLDGFTNTCECGADYNMSGQLLAPREQWGEETGETDGDITLGDLSRVFD